MKARRAAPTIEQIYSKAARQAAARVKAWHEPRTEVARLMRADYIAALGRNLSREDVEWILSRARNLWPGLNRVKYKVPSLKRVARVAEGEGVRLQASPYRGGVALALRGFYVDVRKLGGKRPLIFLNTAHHPAIVALTWLHEMGHHLTRPLMKHGGGGMHFMIDAGYDLHLKDRSELAADLIVAVGIYPEPEVARLFLAQPALEKIARPGKIDSAIMERIFGYARERTSANLPDAERKRARDLYLPEAIHFTKLRCALVATYGI